MYYFPSLADHLLVLLFGLVVPFMSGVRGSETLPDIQFTTALRRRFYLANSLFLGGAASIILLSWLLQRRSFAELGFRLPQSGSNLLWAFAITGILSALYLVDVFYAVRKARMGKSSLFGEESGTTFLPRSISDLPAYLVMCLSAGVFEEIIYRGFMVTYFLPEKNFDTGLPVLAAIVPAFLFSLAHYYQGVHAVLKIFLLSLLLGMIFLMSRSLWIVMAIHFLIDLSGGLLAMKYFRENDVSAEGSIWAGEPKKDDDG